MERVITFGCSLTYGHGLPDCFSPPRDPGLNPSNLGWPSIIAKCLDRECINKGIAGCSNVSILNEILAFDFDPTDIVSVMWTFRVRETFFDPTKKPKYKGRWDSDWLAQQNIYDLAVKNMLHMHHAQNYLTNKNLKFYFTDIDFTYEFGNLNPTWFKDVKIIDADIDKFDRSLPLGLDNLHPGPIFHKAVAKKLLAEICGISIRLQEQ
jgi:hypothetical protein